MYRKTLAVIIFGLAEALLLTAVSVGSAEWFAGQWGQSIRYSVVGFVLGLGYLLSSAAIAHRISKTDDIRKIYLLRSACASTSVVLLFAFLYLSQIGAEISRLWVLSSSGAAFIMAFTGAPLMTGYLRGILGSTRTILVLADSELGTEDAAALDALTLQDLRFTYAPISSIYKPEPSLAEYDEIWCWEPTPSSYQQISRIVGLSPVPVTILRDPTRVGASAWQTRQIGRFEGMTTSASEKKTLQLALKRGFDISVAILLLFILSPALLMLGLLVKCSSKGPVFYRQGRITQHGRAFTILKFRTMLVVQHDEVKGMWGAEGSKPVTKVGSVMRRFSLDELPQLVNVLLGDMSLVGPRPERKEFVYEFAEKIPRYMQKHLMPSGMTGLAQISGAKGDTDLHRRIALDIEYIDSWSFALDLYILSKTLHVAFIAPLKKPGGG